MTVAADLLRQFVERLERLYEERKGISDDIRDVFTEAKAMGLDAGTLRKAIERRAMAPDARREADALLEGYEAALGGESDEVPDARPDIAALALAMLAEQLEGLEDPAQAALLIEHVLFLLDLRAEIRELRAQESGRKKLAAGEGFDAKQLGVTVRWYEKVAKHGEDAMRAGEATFHAYRGTMDRRFSTSLETNGEVSADPKLQGLFSPPPAKSAPKRVKSLHALRAQAEAARKAANGEF